MKGDDVAMLVCVCYPQVSGIALVVLKYGNSYILDDVHQIK